jgi:hypothetical protein
VPSLFLLGAAVRIKLPATFQFSPATSKSIDTPDNCGLKLKVDLYSGCDEQ